MSKENKLVRVEVEFEDGTIRMLTGKEATRYVKKLNECLFMASIHGAKLELEKFDWVVTNKYPAK